MENKNTNILLFGDKRNRETRLRRSIVSIDDTDYLMEVRTARRRSIALMTANDDIDLSSGSPTNWNIVWKDFSISPDNIRNILPLNKGKNGGSSCGGEVILGNPLPDLSPGNNSPQTNAHRNGSPSSREPLSFKNHPSVPDQISSSLGPPDSLSATADASPSKPQHPAWYDRLGAISRREHQQCSGR
jgi:hypothetical protein